MFKSGLLDNMTVTFTKAPPQGSPVTPTNRRSVTWIAETDEPLTPLRRTRTSVLGLDNTNDPSVLPPTSRARDSKRRTTIVTVGPQKGAPPPSPTWGGTGGHKRRNTVTPKAGSPTRGHTGSPTPARSPKRSTGSPEAGRSPPRGTGSPASRGTGSPASRGTGSPASRQNAAGASGRHAPSPTGVGRSGSPESPPGARSWARKSLAQVPSPTGAGLKAGGGVYAVRSGQSSAFRPPAKQDSDQSVGGSDSEPTTPSSARGRQPPDPKAGRSGRCGTIGLLYATLEGTKAARSSAEAAVGALVAAAAAAASRGCAAAPSATESWVRAHHPADLPAPRPGPGAAVDGDLPFGDLPFDRLTAGLDTLSLGDSPPAGGDTGGRRRLLAALAASSEVTTETPAAAPTEPVPVADAATEAPEAATCGPVDQGSPQSPKGNGRCVGVSARADLRGQRRGSRRASVSPEPPIGALGAPFPALDAPWRPGEPLTRGTSVMLRMGLQFSLPSDSHALSSRKPSVAVAFDRQLSGSVDNARQQAVLEQEMRRQQQIQSRMELREQRRELTLAKQQELPQRKADGLRAAMWHTICALTAVRLWEAHTRRKVCGQRTGKELGQRQGQQDTHTRVLTLPPRRRNRPSFPLL